MIDLEILYKLLDAAWNNALRRLERSKPGEDPSPDYHDGYTNGLADAIAIIEKHDTATNDAMAKGMGYE